MRLIWTALALILALSFPVARAASPVFDINVFYFSDAMSFDGDDSSYSRIFWDIMVGMPLNSRKNWILGWNYDSYSFVDNPATETQLSIKGMGPKLIWYMNRERTWVLGLVYNLITTGAYTSASVNDVELRGTSLRAEVGYTAPLSESLLMGVKLNYYKASFSQKVTGGTTLEDVSDGRTVIYPSFTMTYRFD